MKKVEDIKNIEKLYDERAKKVDAAKAAGQWKNEELIPEICQEICNKIGLTQKHRILEIGCGSGVLGNILQNNSAEYIGFDLSFQMLKKFFSENGKNKKPNLFQSVTHLIPFQDETFDVIVMNGVTMYLHDDEILEDTFREMKRITSKNGVIFLGENIIPSGMYWEFVWFQNSSKNKQKIMKPYIDFRRLLASKSDKFAGKWKLIHRDIDPSLIRNSFAGTVEMSDSASQKIRKKLQGKNYKGNRRVDFVIKLG